MDHFNSSKIERGFTNALNTLPPELVSNITNRVDFCDIEHLWLIGDKSLQMTLGERGGVSSIDPYCSRRRSYLWPRLLTSLKGLKEITVMVADTFNDKEVDRLPPSVTRLKLLSDYTDSLLSWFSMVRHRQPHPLPCLRDLSIPTPYVGDWMLHLAHLPSTLQTLRLPHLSPIGVTQLRILPATLTFIKCAVKILHHSKAEYSSVEPLAMPNLCRFSVRVEGGGSIFPYLPPSIEILHCSLQIIQQEEFEQLSRLSLTSLSLLVGNFDEEIARYFPSSLTKLKLECSSDLPPTILRHLPESLTWASLHPLALFPEDLFTSSDTTPPFHLPPGLTTIEKLDCRLPLRLIPALPRGLRRLNTSFYPIPTNESLADLPQALEALSLVDLDDAPISVLPPRLTRLIAASVTLSTESLNALAKTLTSLSLKSVQVESMGSAVKGLRNLTCLRFHTHWRNPDILVSELASLPPYLTELDLHCGSLDYQGQDKAGLMMNFKLDHLTILDLVATSSDCLSGSILVNLPRTVLNCTLGSIADLTDEHMSAMPAKLEHLRIYGPGVVVSNASVSAWSRNLKSLTLPKNSGSLDEKCVKDLPQGLEDLSIDGTQPNLFMIHLYGFDPNTYCEMPWEPHEDLC